MAEKSYDKLYKDCQELFKSCDIHVTRAYARSIGVEKPTEKLKLQLIEDIVGVLSGRISPIEISTRGAPVKNNYVPPHISAKMDEIKLIYATMLEKENPIAYTPVQAPFDYTIKKPQKPSLNVIEFQDEEYESDNFYAPIYKGQLTYFNKVAQLIPLNCQNGEDIIIVSERLIKEHDLREGDTITCRAKRQDDVYLVTIILSVNEMIINTFSRGAFEKDEVVYPCKTLQFIDYNKPNTTFCKYLQWFAPICKGQRVCISAPPKSGKTTLAYELLKSISTCNSDMVVLALLVDQSPEIVAKFRQALPKDSLVYTTYEDDVDRQIFACNFLLNRAKRFAEMKRDVVLVVDGLNAMARAYNETDASAGGKMLAGGMESKTIHYIKKFFGSARAFGNGGSLTIIGTLSTSTGSPFDDVLTTEIKPIVTADIVLDSALAMRHIYPALSPTKTHVSLEGDEAFLDRDLTLRQQIYPKYGIDGLLSILQSVETEEQLQEKLSMFV